MRAGGGGGGELRSPGRPRGPARHAGALGNAACLSLGLYALALALALALTIVGRDQVRPCLRHPGNRISSPAASGLK